MSLTHQRANLSHAKLERANVRSRDQAYQEPDSNLHVPYGD